MNDHLKNYEESIRADERAKLGKRYDKAIDLIKKGLSMLDKTDPDFREVPSKPKAERKVTSTLDQRLAVELILHGTNSSGGALSIKEITRGVTFGPKIVGAALRQLVAEGKAVERPRGKFKAVEKPVVTEDVASA